MTEDHVTTTGQPASTTTSQPASSPDSEVKTGDETTSLREALKEAEHQNQLINAEYGKLLREKEVRVGVAGKN